MSSREILIVEDNPDIRDTLRDVLELHGYAVRTAENGRVGLDMLKGAAPALILLDLMMPVMDGWEFLKAVRGTPGTPAAAIPITVVTGSMEQHELERRYGVRVIAKPVDVDRLLDIAKHYCGPGDELPAA